MAYDHYLASIGGAGNRVNCGWIKVGQLGRLGLHRSNEKGIKGGQMVRKWDYLVEELHGQIASELARFGQEGWELLQVIGTTYYFKRAKS